MNTSKRNDFSKPIKPVILDFVGTHSSGKTTVVNPIANILQGLGYSVDIIESASRKQLSSHSLKIYGDVTELSQAFISIVNWGNILNSSADFVLCTDLAVRGLGYTLSADQPQTAMENTHKQFVDFFNSFQFSACRDVMWFYLPIEFNMVGDEIRPNDEDYRKKVDENIKYVLTSCSVPHITLSGSVENRCRMVIRELSKRFL